MNTKEMDQDFNEFQARINLPKLDLCGVLQLYNLYLQSLDAVIEAYARLLLFKNAKKEIGKI